MAVSFVAAGTAATGSNANLSPGAPAGSLVGDLYVAFLTARTTTGAFSTPASWSLHASFPHVHASSQPVKMYVFTIPVTSNGQAVPTFTYSGATGESVVGQVACFRGVDTTAPWAQIGGFFDSINTQNIGSISGITGIAAGNAVLVLGSKADDWTSVATLTADTDSYVEIGEPDETTGNDAGEVWDYLILTAPRTLAARTFAVTGGGSNYSCAVYLELAQLGGTRFITPSPVTLPLAIPAPTRLAGAITKTPSPVAIPLVLATPTVTQAAGPRTPSPVAVPFVVPAPTILRAPADTAFVFTPAKEQLGRGELDIRTQDWRVLLVAGNTTAHANPDARYVSDITTLDEYDGANYLRKSLIDSAVVRQDSADRAWLDAADVSWGALGPGTRPIANAVLYRHVGADSANPLIACLGRGGGPLQGDGRTLTLHWADPLGPIAIT